MLTSFRINRCLVTRLSVSHGHPAPVWQPPAVSLLKPVGVVFGPALPPTQGLSSPRVSVVTHGSAFFTSRVSSPPSSPWRISDPSKPSTAVPHHQSTDDASLGSSHVVRTSASSSLSSSASTASSFISNVTSALARPLPAPIKSARAWRAAIAATRSSRQSSAASPPRPQPRPPSASDPPPTQAERAGRWRRLLRGQRAAAAAGSPGSSSAADGSGDSGRAGGGSANPNLYVISPRAAGSSAAFELEDTSELAAQESASRASGAGLPDVHLTARSVATAIAGNLVVFTGKLVAAWYSGSGVMFAEALHSLVDTANQVLLMVGIRAAAQEPSAAHPYGYAPARFAYALVSATGVFFLGCGATLYHGLGQLFLGTHVVDVSALTIAVLGGSFVIESATFLYAVQVVRTLARQGRGVSFLEYMREGSDTTAIAVVIEDFAAVASLLIAMGSLYLTHVTGNCLFDTIGTLVVGTGMGFVAGFLIRRNLHMIIGRSVDSHTIGRVTDIVFSRPSVVAIHDLKAITYGPEDTRFKGELQFNGHQLAQQVLYGPPAKVPSPVPRSWRPSLPNNEGAVAGRRIIHLLQRGSLAEAEARERARVERMRNAVQFLFSREAADRRRAETAAAVDAALADTGAKGSASTSLGAGAGATAAPGPALPAAAPLQLGQLPPEVAALLAPRPAAGMSRGAAEALLLRFGNAAVQEVGHEVDQLEGLITTAFPAFTHVDLEAHVPTSRRRLRAAAADARTGAPLEEHDDAAAAAADAEFAAALALAAAEVSAQAVPAMATDAAATAATGAAGAGADAAAAVADVIAEVGGRLPFTTGLAAGAMGASAPTTAAATPTPAPFSAPASAPEPTSASGDARPRFTFVPGSLSDTTSRHAGGTGGADQEPARVSRDATQELLAVVPSLAAHKLSAAVAAPGPIADAPMATAMLDTASATDVGPGGSGIGDSNGLAYSPPQFPWLSSDASLGAALPPTDPYYEAVAEYYLSRPGGQPPVIGESWDAVDADAEYGSADGAAALPEVEQAQPANGTGKK